jgi:hypothetical protein
MAISRALAIAKYIAIINSGRNRLKAMNFELMKFKDRGRIFQQQQLIDNYKDGEGIML